MARLAMVLTHSSLALIWFTFYPAPNPALI